MCMPGMSVLDQDQMEELSKVILRALYVRYPGIQPHLYDDEFPYFPTSSSHFAFNSEPLTVIQTGTMCFQGYF